MKRDFKSLRDDEYMKVQMSEVETRIYWVGFVPSSYRHDYRHAFRHIFSRLDRAAAISAQRDSAAPLTVAYMYQK